MERSLRRPGDRGRYPAQGCEDGEMNPLNPYRSPECQQTARHQGGVKRVKTPIRLWRQAVVVSFMIILLLPTGSIIQVWDGRPAIYVYFWWAYVPNAVLDAGFTLTMPERVVTIVVHFALSLLLGCTIQLVTSFLWQRFSNPSGNAG